LPEKGESVAAVVNNTRLGEMLPTRVILSLGQDVTNGLMRVPRSLPAKYFYDEKGSWLFDQICDSPEYYPTRAENALLAKVANDIINEQQPRCIVELGSGTARKTRHLFDACSKAGFSPTYVPIDVCDEILIASKNALEKEYEWLEVNPIAGDYTGGLGNLPRYSECNLVAFLGGTIGNFSEDEARNFLADLRSTMTENDALLIGADRIKPPEVLHAAYNDDAGVTAAFNLNVLEVLNRELDATFDLDGFEHYAYFNPIQSRIEMHLVSTRNQSITLGSLQKEIDFNEGDHILTEISRKFTRIELENMLVDAGFEVVKHYESDGHKFSLLLGRPV
jgi:L-histidine N-alpha-methyltransferase